MPHSPNNSSFGGLVQNLSRDFRQNTWVLILQMPYSYSCLAQKNLKPLFGLDSSFIQQALGKACIAI